MIDETVLINAIAHEVTQPLTAMMANAAAGLRWLDRSTPDLERRRRRLTGSLLTPSAWQR